MDSGHWNAVVCTICLRVKHATHDEAACSRTLLEIGQLYTRTKKEHQSSKAVLEIQLEKASEPDILSSSLSSDDEHFF